MKKTSIALLCLLALGFAACSGSGSKKRVVIMASGTLTVTGKTIKLDPSLRHNEQDVNFPDDKVTLSVQVEGGNSKSFDLTDNGVYVLNLQNDTLIGGIVNYGEGGRPGRITGDQLSHIIDSTKQMMAGTNASDAKGTYFIPPQSIKRVSSKMNTKIIGTFKGIPYSNEADGNGQVPDLIKFFTNNQKRETLKDLEDQKEKLR